MLAAETGCGKTLAYLAPIIQQILAHKEKVKFKNQFNSPLALVIVPGRELADQIGVCSLPIIFDGTILILIIFLNNKYILI